MALIHGGQLDQVAEQYKIPVSDWLDLSTGIAPMSYPIPNIPLNAWQQLPQENRELLTAAEQYYQCSQILITNGSQAIIKALPELYRQHNAAGQAVYLPARGYKEHAHAWKMAGYHLHFYQESLPVIAELASNSVVVIINPNNPTGKFFGRDVIAQYHEKLTKINGLLVLDEAFIDVMPSHQSFCDQVDNDHILVLRSFGKFFGLAGIRIGFLAASDHWCTKFKALLGPWQVNGPAQVIAKKALTDKEWHKEQCKELARLRSQQEIILREVFTEKLVNTIQGCDLFLTLRFHKNEHAKKIYQLLCQQGIYCRLADEQDTLRFGITIAENFKRLESVCRQACSEFT